MTRDPSDSVDRTRRRFLTRVGLGVVGLSALPSSASASDSGRVDSTDALGPEAFRVTGREISRITVRPETVTVRKRKISSDLRRRYGLTPPVLTKTETFERPAPEADDLPRRATDTVKRPWDTYYAKTDEWTAYFEGTPGVGPAYHEPVEERHPYGTWEYEAVDGGFEVTAPMNVISESSTNAVTDVLTDGEWTDYVVQYDRHAWNSESHQFETQHQSTATGVFGFLGRYHLKMWEFEGYVSGSAHVDSSVPHEATSFEEAEQEIGGVFDDASGWAGRDDYYDLDNAGFLDHDGEATKLHDEG